MFDIQYSSFRYSGFQHSSFRPQKLRQAKQMIFRVLSELPKMRRFRHCRLILRRMLFSCGLAGLLPILIVTSCLTRTAAAQIKPPAAASSTTEAATAFDQFDGQLKALDFKKYEGLKKQEIEFWRQNFYAPLKTKMIESGEPLARLRRLTKLVFQVHHAENQCAAILVSSKIPTVLTWKLTFVTFTTRDLEILGDDEIIALAAHEIGHLYYTDELLRARNQNDHALERVIELKADLIAAATLKILEIKTGSLTTAIAKLIAARTEENLESFQPGSPSLADRAEVVKKFDAAAASPFTNPFLENKK